MARRRVTALIAAAVLALLAGAAVVLYVQGANERSVRGQDAKMVWMSVSAIPRGTKMSAAKKMLKQEYVPVRSAPESAVVALGDGKLVAASDIAAGEILMKDRFVDESKLGPQTLTVPGGHVAMSAKVLDYQRVGAFVKPGDFVAIFYASRGHSRVLFSRVQVLGVGTTSEDGSESQDKIPTAVLTVALTSQQGAQLAAVSNFTGKGKPDPALHFALLPAGESAPSNASANMGGS
jgi:pilus assembly protein CpaB